MGRPRFSLAIEVWDLLRSLSSSLRRQRLGIVFPLALVLILISLFFGFLSLVQMISPFVYPLF